MSTIIYVLCENTINEGYEGRNSFKEEKILGYFTTKESAQIQFDRELVNRVHVLKGQIPNSNHYPAIKQAAEGRYTLAQDNEILINNARLPIFFVKHIDVNGPALLNAPVVLADAQEWFKKQISHISEQQHLKALALVKNTFRGTNIETVVNAVIDDMIMKVAFTFKPKENEESKHPEA